jgi:Cd2+/Zn2+-exporting ATPase
VSVVSAMTNAASRGVLIKGGRYLDALSRVKVFAFDKTGTLTAGQPVVTDALDVCNCGRCPEDCGLWHAASLEVNSSHPLARALLAEANGRQLDLFPAQDVKVLSGRGIEGTVNGSPVTVASHSHFDQHFPHDPEICRQAEDLAAQGKTVVLVQHDDLVCGLFAVADQPRESSRKVVADLRMQGMQTVMLTGDNPSVAAEIGRQVGVESVRAGLLPEEKMTAVADLSAEHGAVAMVGDGVNDAPALAQAEVGIAMGGAGSDQAMETADVVLMGDDLTQLPFALMLSRRTRRVIAGNIIFALAIKVAVFGLAAAGLATLWMAIVADVGASMAVILNGMRLRKVS